MTNPWYLSMALTDIICKKNAQQELDMYFKDINWRRIREGDCTYMS